MLCKRAAMLTPSPIRSPSLSSTKSPKWTPMRNAMRRSGGRPALRSTIPFCTSIAQRTASTTLRNSTIAPSPVRFTTRPLWTATIGSMRSLPKRPQPREYPILIGASEPAISDYVRYQNRCELPGLGHGYHCSIERRSLLGLDYPDKGIQYVGPAERQVAQVGHARWAGIVAVRSVGAMSQNHPDKVRGRWLRKRGSPLGASVQPIVTPKELNISQVRTASETAVQTSGLIVRTEYGVTVECLKCGHVGFLVLKHCRARAFRPARQSLLSSNVSGVVGAAVRACLPLASLRHSGRREGQGSS